METMQQVLAAHNPSTSDEVLKYILDNSNKLYNTYTITVICQRPNLSEEMFDLIAKKYARNQDILSHFVKNPSLPERYSRKYAKSSSWHIIKNLLSNPNLHTETLRYLYKRMEKPNGRLRNFHDLKELTINHPNFPIDIKMFLDLNA